MKFNQAKEQLSKCLQGPWVGALQEKVQELDGEQIESIPEEKDLRVLVD